MNSPLNISKITSSGNSCSMCNYPESEENDFVYKIENEDGGLSLRLCEKHIKEIYNNTIENV